MTDGRIQSNVFTSPDEFMLETYSLEDPTQLFEYFERPVQDLWVLRNTSSSGAGSDSDNRGLKLIANETKFREQLVLKLPKGLVAQKLNQLQTGHIAAVATIDEWSEEETKSPIKQHSMEEQP